ncbi:Gfo/Idh/MocA family oxidoreductase [Draconibacterium sp.]|nr:Gfo/Idh/MocA family oxidoreductase [Draconibacterium sp.]
MKRRRFIGKTVIGTAGLTVTGSLVSLSSCNGANDKIVMALIGSGSRGTDTIIGTCKVNENVEIKTICDVNDFKASAAIDRIEKELGYKPGHSKNMKEVFDDKEIDAVMISTPEHWHALATVWACQAGKHVYVEKNPTLSIWEGKKMIEAAEKYKRIVQVGFQNRSAPYAFSAKEYITSGKLGQIIHVKTYNMLGANNWRPQPDGEIPNGLDWDSWLGPAAYRPYNDGIHNMNSRGGWTNFWDFSGGALSDDASHIMDLARFVLGDPGHPKSIYGWGGNYAFGVEKDVPEFQSITYNFDKFELTCESGNATNYLKKTPGNIRNSNSEFPDWKQNATRIEIYGTEGMMYLGRHGGGWQVIGENGEIVAEEYGTVPDTAHQQNFIESIRERKEPNGSVLQGHLSASLVHLGNITFRAGNKQLLFDTENENFKDNKEANQFLKTGYREGFTIPENV